MEFNTQEVKADPKVEANTLGDYIDRLEASEEEYKGSVPAG